MLRFCIVELYCGDSGKIGYYNSQEVGIAKAMKKLGYKCYVFYPSFQSSADEVTELDSITIVKCPAKKVGVHARYNWNVLLKYKIDVAQIDGDNQMFAPNVLRFCRKHGIVNYTYSGSIISGNTNLCKKILMNVMLSRNLYEYKKTRNFAKTESVKRDLIARGVKSKIDVVPVGLDLAIIPELKESKPELRKKLDLPADKKILLFVGRIDEYKNPLDMIDVVSALPEDHYAVMIGDGKLSKALESRIHENKLEKRIRWIKSLPNHEIHGFYAAADYMLNFNPNEIFGMCLLEALYQGCTTIALRAPGPNLILGREHGFLVNDKKEMLDVLKTGVHLDPDKLRKYVISDFSWDNAANRFDAHIKNVFKMVDPERNP